MAIPSYLLAIRQAPTIFVYWNTGTGVRELEKGHLISS